MSTVTSLIAGLFSLLPSKLPEFLYTVVLRPRPLRLLTNTLICHLLPESVVCGPGVIVLNPNDPVVSGAIALGVYEKPEKAFFLANCSAGMTCIDIGANMGFYTGMASHLVGAQGQVIALEPDPESYSYLQKTIEKNKSEKVQSFQLAASASAGKAELYLSPENRGDNRLYKPDFPTSSITIDTVTIDSLLEGQKLSSDLFIKVDTQGAEAWVLAGMEQTIRTAGKVILMSEFWPRGLKTVESDPLEYLTKLESLDFRLHEFCGQDGQLSPVTDKEKIIERHPGRHYTTIIGIKGNVQLAET